jgi:hypothetical protein
MRSSALLGLALAVSCAIPALADEQLIPLAQSGSWAAVEHRPSMMDPPDVCLASVINGAMALRSDGTTVELRSGNDSWSLPDGVQGSISFTVNGNTYSFDIVSNTDTMVSADVDADKVQPILDDMAKASSLTLTIGKAKPISVSLSGSSKALNAFRTCAGIGGGAAGGGTNPFQ